MSEKTAYSRQEGGGKEGEGGWGRDSENGIDHFSLMWLADFYLLWQEARRHWDLFYKRNTTNFFKDRRWLVREFPRLLEQGNAEVSNSIHL